MSYYCTKCGTEITDVENEKSEFCPNCGEKLIENPQSGEITQQNPKPKKKKWKKRGIVLGIIAGSIALILLLTNVIIPRLKYSDIISLIHAEKYDEAIIKLEADKDSGSKKYLLEARYKNGKKMLNEENYAEAKKNFRQCLAYQDAKQYYDCILALPCLEEYSRTLYSDNVSARFDYKIHYKYDDKGNVTESTTEEKTTYNPSFISPKTESKTEYYTYNYDEKGNRTKETHQKSDGNTTTWEYSYEYNDKGNISKKTAWNPDSKETFIFQLQYDDKNRVSTLTKGKEGAEPMKYLFGYDDSDNIVRCQMGNDVVEYSYDEFGDMKEETLSKKRTSYSYGDIYGEMTYENPVGSSLNSFTYSNFKYIYCPELKNSKYILCNGVGTGLSNHIITCEP